jgi:uncharacterized cofD-like protein
MSPVAGASAAALLAVRQRPPLPASRAPRIVALGGGTGVPVLLRGLSEALFSSTAPGRPAEDRERITAIITTSDDGGSSGRLRHPYGLAPGDVRNSLLALSATSSPLAALFGFRFEGDGEVAGHSLGNLMLTALTQLEGSFAGAVTRAAEILAVRGRVLPATTEIVSLTAEFVDGAWLDGESRIAAARRPIRQIRLRPETARATPEAVAAIEAADLVAIGPGSLYTSLIPVLLVREIAEAIARSAARVVLVMNLMTEPGETDGYSAVDCLMAIRRHAPRVPIHHVLLNSGPLPPAPLDRYAAEGAAPIGVAPESIRALGCRARARAVAGEGPKIRHDSHKLARAILELAAEVNDD